MERLANIFAHRSDKLQKGLRMTDDIAPEDAASPEAEQPTPDPETPPTATEADPTFDPFAPARELEPAIVAEKSPIAEGYPNG